MSKLYKINALLFEHVTLFNEKLYWTLINYTNNVYKLFDIYFFSAEIKSDTKVKKTKREGCVENWFARSCSLERTIRLQAGTRISVKKIISNFRKRKSFEIKQVCKHRKWTGSSLWRPKLCLVRVLAIINACAMGLDFISGDVLQWWGSSHKNGALIWKQ